jgi:hypothetical protein
MSQSPTQETEQIPQQPRVKAVVEEFVSQGKKDFRKNWPEWVRQLPIPQFPPKDTTFQLIDKQHLREAMARENADPEAVQRIEEDIEFLDHELLRLFRDRDYEAKFEQNRYRSFQIGFMLLATLATVMGSFQAIAVNTRPDVLPWLAFGETVVALFTTYLATISGRESPLPSWLENRRHAEYLRREYYRYLMDLPPYDELSGYERKQMLSIRAANINRGVYPDKSAEQ